MPFTPSFDSEEFRNKIFRKNFDVTVFRYVLFRKSFLSDFQVKDPIESDEDSSLLFFKLNFQQ